MKFLSQNDMIAAGGTDGVFQISPNVAEHMVGGLACSPDGLAKPMITSTFLRPIHVELPGKQM